MTSGSIPALCSLIQMLKQEEQKIAEGSVFLTAVFHLLKKITGLNAHTFEYFLFQTAFSQLVEKTKRSVGFQSTYFMELLFQQHSEEQTNAGGSFSKNDTQWQRPIKK